ncbi:RNA polymerase subunit sigma [Streptomyces sp. NPDC052015]|uniref:RNA polymerase subunit sigma n=1 Tax=Streptomyces sp. NPDC052015 TaxID=3154755 RepID=UPI00342263A3
MDPAGDTMPISELLDERRHLVEVAHWMLGSRMAAERVTDEAYREWYGLSDHQRARIQTPRAWLTRVVGSISLARLAPPGPGVDAQGSTRKGGPRDTGLEGEVSGVLPRTWDTLSPAERAAFVLNDAFGGAGGKVAGSVQPTGPDRTEPADRARHSLRARRAEPASPRRQDEIAHAVRQACADEDVGRLASLLTHDVTAFFDGGGKVRALTRPVTGSGQVAPSLLNLLARHPRTTLHTCPVNGRTGLVARYDDQVAAVVTLDVTGSRVVQVWVVLNPDKLRSWNRPRS